VRKFYVYCYYEPGIVPEHGSPFYVGKGHGRRAYTHLSGCQRQRREGYGSLFYRKLRKMLSCGIQPEIEIVMDMLTEDEAFAFERELIRCIGRRNLGKGPLCNLTDGGDGASGHVVSEEVRQRIREKHLGKTLSCEHRQRIGDAIRGREVSEETRRRIGDCRRGKKHSKKTRQRLSQHFYGKKHSAETRAKMSAAHRLSSVEGFHLDGHLICQFDSIKSVASGGYTPCCVSNCLVGRQKTHRQLKWRYVGERSSNGTFNFS